MGKKTKKKNKKEELFKIPKTVQDTIPYIAVYKNGRIETEEGVFSKTYKLEDVNFKLALFFTFLGDEFERQRVCSMP